jgi:hypothetical protein
MFWQLSKQTSRTRQIARLCTPELDEQASFQWYWMVQMLFKTCESYTELGEWI